MAKKYYAHSKPVNLIDNKSRENWHLLKDHLQSVAEISSSFASEFNCSNWGYLIGLLHDTGKYSKEFQDYLLKSSQSPPNKKPSIKVDHSTAGGQYVSGIDPQIGKLLAYCICGHHSGLPDGLSSESSCLNERLKKEVPEYHHADTIKSNLDLPKNPPFPISTDRAGIQLFFLIKMLFSSLVDADFLDSENFFDYKRTSLRGSNHTLRDLHHALSNNMDAMLSNVPDTNINKIRKDILKDCIEASSLPPGLFSLTVPTGGGKTLSSMRFALEHAIKNKKERIIYVIPYTNIIEQNAEVFREFLHPDAVIEHHSNFEYDDNDFEYNKAKLASENWDWPVIITTSVQFYESLFSNKTSKNRKLHNIVNSVIILDEVQKIPLEYLIPCIESLRELSQSYNCTTVLCSATQPAIIKRNDFPQGLENVREIAKSPNQLAEKLKRVQAKYLGVRNEEEIAEELSNASQGLCIVNTKKTAAEIFRLLPQENSYHLSTNMYPAHRRKVLEEIKGRLNNHEACLLVSTQLVEAGVDIDFPVVYRAMAGLDSIAQAAGRCNREGRLDWGKLFIFEPENGCPPGFLTQSANETVTILNTSKKEILDLSNIEEYFKNLYWISEEQLDKEGIVKEIEESKQNLNFPFKKVSENFKLIKDDTKPLIIQRDKEAKKLISEVNEFANLRKISRQLQKYTVQVHQSNWAKLFEYGAIEIVQDTFPVLIRDELYDEKIGLNLDNLEIDAGKLIV
ncbi:CRISPR-associated helicase/endonuclease Cas3 [Sedimentisphaera salicampi]|uniref:Helicase Cas3 n=1 Tax=Sedimentisphaera salicampi TaxID=1941349 RepID=A0A1W6LLL9_9BACT|nr:CRISPR-associated helicase/endonuclease Cas3 [Sedimentisphaera salicampi]ARN56657.1 helicase Cas3 [Sedimentisphaera salicampi]